jgi:hypothetical protein
MSDAPNRLVYSAKLPARANLEHLKNEARQLLKTIRTCDCESFSDSDSQQLATCCCSHSPFSPITAFEPGMCQNNDNFASRRCLITGGYERAYSSCFVGFARISVANDIHLHGFRNFVIFVEDIQCLSCGDSRVGALRASTAKLGQSRSRIGRTPNRVLSHFSDKRVFSRH